MLDAKPDRQKKGFYEIGSDDAKIIKFDVSNY